MHGTDLNSNTSSDTVNCTVSGGLNISADKRHTQRAREGRQAQRVGQWENSAEADIKYAELQRKVRLGSVQIGTWGGGRRALAQLYPFGDPYERVRERDARSLQSPFVRGPNLYGSWCMNAAVWVVRVYRPGKLIS